MKKAWYKYGAYFVLFVGLIIYFSLDKKMFFLFFGLLGTISGLMGLVKSFMGYGSNGANPFQRSINGFTFKYIAPKKAEFLDRISLWITSLAALFLSALFIHAYLK